jgi:hypothetical protein
MIERLRDTAAAWQGQVGLVRECSFRRTLRTVCGFP